MRTLKLILLLALAACGGEKKPVADENPTPANPQLPYLPGTQYPDNNNPPTTADTVTFRQNVTVAVLDSGVDITQPTLSSQIWRSTREVANLVDDDGNAYVDDVTGWNFVEGNSAVFDTRAFVGAPPDAIRFMHLSSLYQYGPALASADKTWIEQKYGDKNYLNQISIYSTLSHGTHVSGIITKTNTRARILPIKILATGATAKSGDANFAQFILRNVLGGLQGTGTGFGDAIRYAVSQGALVANGSFGFGVEEAREALDQLGSGISLNVADSLVSSVLSRVAETLSREISQAQNTLFVFAAGNESANNDTTVRLPANTRQLNSITVAATQGRQTLAKFSNYGASRVDVAAPGVGIVSTMPGNQNVEMSGTSMAAPYVARVASQIRSVNPQLSVADTRRILLETVDVKDFLRGKVVTSGIVNPARALLAAELSTRIPVSSAIQQARAGVADVVSEE